MKRKTYKLDDSVIAGIARAVQQALLTGVDVIDHFRMMRLEVSRKDENALVFTKEYEDYERESIDQLVEEAEQMNAVEEGQLELGDKLYDEVQEDELLYVNDKPVFGSGDKHGPN